MFFFRSRQCEYSYDILDIIELHGMRIKELHIQLTVFESEDDRDEYATIVQAFPSVLIRCQKLISLFFEVDHGKQVSLDTIDFFQKIFLRILRIFV